MRSCASDSNSDRLSDLPDSLILEILSLLPMTDVVATMLLSKRWLHLWTAVPCLDFNYKYKYEDFVTAALAHWRGSKIRKFSFTFQHQCIVIADDVVDSWLLFAIEKRVEELHLCYDYDYIEQCPPPHLYSCSSITKLSLTDCQLVIDEAVAVQWSRLRRLETRDVESYGHDAMDKILAGAPLLEELVLECFNSTKNLNIRSISLKFLKFVIRDYTWFPNVLIIRAPNLLDLEVSGCFYGHCLLDVPSLTNATIGFRDSGDAAEAGVSLPPDGMFHWVFQRIRHVEKLTLSQFSVVTLLPMKQSIEFPNLKSLSFCAGGLEELLGVLDMFPNLTTLWVQHDEDAFLSLTEDLCEADLPRPFVPYLKRVEITWFMSDAPIIPALGILLENAKLLDKMVFRADWCYWWEHVDTEKPELLLSKLASSATAEVTIIHV